MSHHKQELIEETSNKLNAWNSQLSKALTFDPVAEKLKLEILKRALQMREESIKHFATVATSFTIQRFLINDIFFMAHAKQMGYAFEAFEETMDSVDPETGSVVTDDGVLLRCNETTEEVWMSKTTGKSVMTKFFKK